MAHQVSKDNMQVLFSDVLREWNYEKNGELTPDKMTPGSSKKVWWKCEKGHEWEASPYTRTKLHSGCPYCSGNRALIGVNDLATLFPEIAAEWNYEKNGDLNPNMFMSGSSKKVWWKCEKGHEWEASIHNRTAFHSGCPYCSGNRALPGVNDLATLFPEIAAEWNYEKNGDLNPNMFMSGSSKKVWWRCSKCENEWQATIYSRTSNGTGCPICGRNKQTDGFRKSRIANVGSLVETHPILCEEWDYEKNGTLTPKDFSFGSNEKIWWRCLRGHEWQATIYSRVQGTGCPKCKSGNRTSLPEKSIVFYLKQCGLSVLENEKVFHNSDRDVDIYLPKLQTAIEYDGEHWHKSRVKDLKKTILCKEHEIRLIRIREPKVGLLNDGYSIEHLTDVPKNDLSHMKEPIKWVLKMIGYTNFDIDPNRDMPKIRAMISKDYDDNSFGNNYPTLAKEWDQDKNGRLSPDDVSKSSAVKVWWLCAEYKHSWQDSVAHRISGRGCPYCSGRRTLVGFNDLKTKYPQIAEEWDLNRNQISPSNISFRNGRKAWWVCPKGHHYVATVAHRTGDGTGCPYCTNQKVLAGYNDLLSNKPAIAQEWDFEKNGDLRPEQFVVNSNKKVWWKCSKCGNEWQAVISSRTISGSGCPTCSIKRSGQSHHQTALMQNGPFQDSYPNLLLEWNYEKNNGTDPKNFTAGSNVSVWWKCSKCGNEWKARIANRTILGRGCPNCASADRAKKKSKAVICIDTKLVYDSINEAATFAGVSPSKISACCRGKQKKAGGFGWAYIDCSTTNKKEEQ